MTKSRSPGTTGDKKLQVFEAARMCYELGLSQREVAETLGLSAGTLSRLLERARDLGIVQFRVIPPEGYARDLEALRERLRTGLSVEEVLVTPTSKHPEIVRRELGYAASGWLMGRLAHEIWVGFSGGRCVAALVPFLKRSESAPQVLQLMGGLSSREHDLEADVIARRASSQLGGDCHVIHGPAIFPDEESLLQFVRNSIVASAIEAFSRLKIAVVGIGTLSPDNPLIRVGFLSKVELARLATEDCVGDICGHFFDEHGAERDGGLARRILGIRLEQLAKVPAVCAVAAGVEKVSAIIGACRARVPKTLVTDALTAEALAARLGV